MRRLKRAFIDHLLEPKRLATKATGYASTV
jgi:hypothetical protein